MYSNIYCLIVFYICGICFFMNHEVSREKREKKKTRKKLAIQKMKKKTKKKTKKKQVYKSILKVHKDKKKKFNNSYMAY